MKMYWYLIVSSLVGYAASQGCTDCYRRHPQQVFCQSNFVVHIVNTSVEARIPLPGSVVRSHNLVTAVLVTDFKSSLAADTQFVEFYSPSSICGTYFYEGGDFVVAGTFNETSNGIPYLLHGNCDFAEEWDQLSARQQKGFSTKYQRLCNCPIQGVKAELNLIVSKLEDGSGYEGAHTYWTPYRNCYYNPLKSERLQRVDCEDEYGFCKKNANNECSWQMTTDYVDCFGKREQYVMALEGSPGMTDIEQCEILRTRRQRKKCRWAFRQNQKSSQAEVVIPFE